jgi:dolichol-phosphate mannosyltransferase
MTALVEGVSMDLSIIIPCYNEVENVPKLRDEFLPVALGLAETRSLEVVFVDDGCTDGTWQALHDVFGEHAQGDLTFGFERHTVNQGLGAAMRTGFAAAQGEMIVTTDSDGTYKFSAIPALLSYLTSETDIVTASPYHPAGGVAGVPAFRLLFSRGCSAMYRLLADWRIYTFTCLFRAYRREVIQNVTFESNGFLAGTELMVKGMLMGYRVAEYPAILHRRAYGESKAKIKRTVLAHLGFQARVLGHRLGLRPIVETLKSRPGPRWA